MVRRSSGWLLVMLLASCKLGPDYERPEIDAPVEFIQTIDAGDAFANMPWWEIFNDERLTELIELALRENKDLAIATARIEEARARLGFVRADLIPRVDGQAGASRGINSVSQFIPGLGIQENYLVAADVFYEIDLFGKLRRSTEAARAELLATEYAKQTVITSLIADVASAYFLLRDLDARTEIATRTLATRRNATAIIQERFNKGIVPKLDVNQAQIEEADAAATLAQVRRQDGQTENLLNVLIGRNPQRILRGLELVDQTSPPRIPVGLPSELLERRPDVRAAEQLLAAQTASIGVAEALRWPSLSLTGSLGLASNELSDFTSSDNKIWNIGANLAGPIYNAGANKRRVEIERARAEQALGQYELAVLVAFREVEDALIAIETLRDESDAREFQVRAARSASTLSRARYNGGVTSYLEVLESDRSLFRAEISASSVRREQLGSVVALYKALGGGWEPDAP